MKPGAERCARLHPNCICPGCLREKELQWGVRCCHVGQKDKVYAGLRDCAIIQCPGYQGKEKS